MRERNILLDCLKGLAIFLVTWGHAIQYAGPTDLDFFHNPVFILIYSFHMPLFMAVSGYLFFQSQAKRSLEQLVKGKVRQILIPTLIWAVPMLWANTFSWEAPTLLFSPLAYVNAVTGALWFLWASFLAAILTAVIAKPMGDSPWMYVVVWLAVLLLPNGHYFFFVKFIVPYFFAGYLYHKYQAHLQLAKTVGVYASLLTFPLLLLAWRQGAFIYIGGFGFSLIDSVHSLMIVLYRYLIGAVGIIVFVAGVAKGLLPLLTPNSWVVRMLMWLGELSLGVYLVGVILTQLFLPHLHLPATNSVVYSLVLTPLLSLGVALISAKITELISQVPVLNQYFLGGRNTNSVPLVAPPALAD